MRLAIVMLVGCATSPRPAPLDNAGKPRSPVAVVEVEKPSPFSAEVASQRAGCEGGDTWDCVRVGLALQSGDGAPIDLPEAARYFTLGCDANIPESCALLVNLYRAGGEGFAADPDKAAELSQRLCDDGFDTHCPIDPADEVE
jgi:TPR repeat protein